ncbi:MAG TPA: hypothetical protein VEU33_45845 [Archangium sp.]|nr:hypothetical protein [Archangium sp.]
MTYTVPAAGTALGKQVIIRFGQGSDGGASDIWFDNLKSPRGALREDACLARSATFW